MADRNEQESSRVSSGRRDFVLPQAAVVALYTLLVVACLAVMFIEPTMREGAFVGLIFALATFPMGLRAGTNADAPSPRESFERIGKAIDRLTGYQYMADFGTCAVGWPLLDEWEAEVTAGKMPDFSKK